MSASQGLAVEGGDRSVLFHESYLQLTQCMTMTSTEIQSEVPDGYVEELDARGRLKARGYYKNGKRTGIWWVNKKINGRIVGEVNEDGELTGSNIAYLYPDSWTALIGEFKDGKLVKAKLGHLKRVINGVPEFHIHESDVEYTRDESTFEKFCDHPHLPDPYESERVYVKTSNITGANEGLFSKLDVGTGVIVSFYNGLRMIPEDVDNRDWSLNGYTMLLSDDVILDIPLEYISLKAYRATLGHKANHSSSPNCVCDDFDHPRFGPIIALQSLRPIKKDEEITINYGYGPLEVGEEIDVPQWYKQMIPYCDQHNLEIKIYKENNKKKDDHMSEK